MQRNTNIDNKKYAIEWVKRGDFSYLFDSGVDLNKQVEYKNITDNPKIEVSLCGYHDDSVKVIFRSKELMNDFLNKCKKEKISVEDDFIAKELGCVSIYSHHDQDKKSLSQFLNCIDSMVPFGSKVKKEIFNTLHLKQIADEKSFYDELEKLLDDGNLEEVIKKANIIDDDHVFWRLGRYCESKQKFPEAISIYQEISEDNPHYQEANQQVMYIVMQYLNSTDENGQELTEQEKKQYQEAEFRFMLSGNDQSRHQGIIDQYYHQLCGSDDLTPTIKNVDCNEDTLIALAKQTSSLRNENSILEERNIKQMKEIESLKEQLGHLNKKTMPAKINQNALFNCPKNENKKKSLSQHTYCGFKPGFLGQ